jgi:hypothetical protein
VKEFLSQRSIRRRRPQRLFHESWLSCVSGSSWIKALRPEKLFEQQKTLFALILDTPGESPWHRDIESPAARTTKEHFIPITNQTCASPHVYPWGKHAVFHKMDA